MNEAGPRVHLLIEVDPIFTFQLWQNVHHKPIVLTPNESGSLLEDAELPRTAAPVGGDAALRQDIPDRALSCIPLFEMIRLAGDGRRVAKEMMSNFGEVLTFARIYFGVPVRERLRVAVVGSHSSLYHHIMAGESERFVRDQALDKHNFMRGMRKDRILARWLGECIALRADDVEAIWLSQAFPELTPKRRARQYADVIAKGRDALAKGGKGFVPLIYTRMAGTKRWHPFVPSDRVPHTVTDRLIEQFAIEKNKNPKLEGVLLKLLPAEIAGLNIADAPVVGQKTVSLAHAAGLSAILLDERFGIVRRIDGATFAKAAEAKGLSLAPAGDSRRFSLPIFAAPVPRVR